MWILKLHIAISILIMIYVFGFRMIFRESINENWFKDKEKSKFFKKVAGRIKLALTCFIPIINIVTSIFLTLMVVTTKEQFEELKKKVEE